MSTLTAKYQDKLALAQKLEQDGYNYAKKHHLKHFAERTSQEIVELANWLVVRISGDFTGDTLCRAMGMARCYREFAAAKQLAA